MGIEIGQIVDGKYRVTAQIGEGGMGAVFAGEHLKLHRKVAIKTLHPSHAGDEEVIRRFEHEAQAAGRIGNDHIIEVYDIGELPGGDRYMVMEFLDGEPLDARLARLKRMTPQQVHPLAKQMLEGLAAAHAAGIVHRDLKPGNIFILREKAGVPDYVKLIDFGISKFKTLAGESSQTRTGTIIGTPSYMSPEQARGLREADARSDIYAVGVILYEAVTGRVPFEGASTNDLLFKIFLNEVPPIELLAKDVDPAFCSIVMKALAKEPADRFGTCGELVAALEAWAQTGQGVPLVKRAEPANTVFEGPRALRQPSTPPPTTGSMHASWAESSKASPPETRPSSAKKVAASIVALAISGAVIAAVLLTLRGVHSSSAAVSSPAASAPSSTTAASPLVTPPTAAKSPDPLREISAVDAAPALAAPPTPAPPPSPPMPSAAAPPAVRAHHGAPAPAPSPAPKPHVDPLEQL